MTGGVSVRDVDVSFPYAPSGGERQESEEHVTRVQRGRQRMLQDSNEDLKNGNS